MRFSLTAISLLAATAALSEAAIIPRADVNAGLHARYYVDRLFPRHLSREAAAHVERANVPEEPNTKRDIVPDARMHPRDLRVTRDTGVEGDKVKRNLKVMNRRLHARDFRLSRATF